MFRVQYLSLRTSVEMALTLQALTAFNINIKMSKPVKYISFNIFMYIFVRKLMKNIV